MILGKLWKALAAQMNKVANFFWTADPIAQLQYEYDKAVDQMKEGREGLEQYRALVERVTRQVNGDQEHVASLEARIKAYLPAGERETASKFALELQQAKIGLNRAKVRVAADLSGQGLEEIQREQAVEKAMADKALREFEVEMGMVTPETAGVKADDKELGSERTRQTAG